MFRASQQHRVFFAGFFLLIALLTGTAVAAVSVNPAQMLVRADSIKTSNHAKFIVLIRRLSDGTMELSPQQQLYLRYLKAFESSYAGDYKSAVQLLNEVIDQSSDPVLRFRAGLTAVNLLGIEARYVDAFSQLNQLLDQLPQVTDKDARLQAMGTASQIYAQAGQYDLALQYAKQLFTENPIGAGACKAITLKLEALYKSQQLQSFDQQSHDGIDVCVKAGEPIFANGIRYYLASVDLQRNQTKVALVLLENNYADVEDTRYPPIISMFNALLAQAYLKFGEIARAKQFALDAVDNSLKNQFTEPLIDAYKVLYEVEERQDDFPAALAFHKKYMAADKGYLNEVSAKALAYQTVKQQVLAKKLQIDGLDKRNRILQLQRALDKKAIETTRLYMILLLTVLAFIAFVAVRIKRSQLRFMRMARRDGLTGLFNRQHFLDEAQRQLQYCRKSARDACLVLIDLDHFKNINDTHGHVAGDEVLKRAVMACQAHLRSTDIFGRLGGEEFGILLPECSLERVSERVEQLRLAIAEIPASDDLCVSVSASFGVATTVFSGYELRQLLIHADDALYQAKNSGRNRAVVFDDADSLRQAGMRKSRVGTPVAEPTA